MNTTSEPNEQPKPIGKGKGRAHETERTPLLGRTSQPYTSDDDPPTPTVARRRLRSKLTLVFFASLSFCIAAFFALALLAYSYAQHAAHVSPDDILHTAVVFRGPDRVDVLNITWDGGIWVNVEGRVGLDAGSIIGVDSDPSADGFWENIWKATGRWGVRRLDKVSVNLSTIDVSPLNDLSAILASVHAPPLVVPLTADPPLDDSWLTNVSTPLLIYPTHNLSTLIQFVRQAWRDGIMAVHADIGQAAIRGGGLNDDSWRSILQGARSNIQAALHIKVPPIPGLPSPGREAHIPSISELITLQSFSVSTESNNLSLHATATFIDPAPLTFNFTCPSMPFIISLPTSNTSNASTIQVASVSSDPFSLTHPNITLLISGTVLPLPSSASTILSNFLTRYLSAQSNPIIISCPLIPDLSVETLFPAPNPRPRILRNVTIQDMKLRASGGSFLASGTVFARVVLPKGMKVGLEVYRVLPDLLVFDGEVPELIQPEGKPTPPAPQLPDPLPPRAFGHIRPDGWLGSMSEPTESEEDEGSAYTVTARIFDVPLQVLPGRQMEFSNFVGKVIFGSAGAVAGLQGTAAVAVEVHGLPLKGPGRDGQMELHGLPFQGNVRVGKKSLFAEDMDLRGLRGLAEEYRVVP